MDVGAFLRPDHPRDRHFPQVGAHVSVQVVQKAALARLPGGAGGRDAAHDRRRHPRLCCLPRTGRCQGGDAYQLRLRRPRNSW